MGVRVLHPPSKTMFNFFKKTKKEPENIKKLLSRFNILEENFEKISGKIKKIEKENEINIQKVGIVRFNPFKEVGSDQSFSVALLDGRNNGVVVTSLYTREGNRVYGKPIKNSQSEYQLSGEEEEAISMAKFEIRPFDKLRVVPRQVEGRNQKSETNPNSKSKYPKAF